MIGMFDSGVGGLSVLLAVRRLLPGAALVYVADSAWFPYGSREPPALAERTAAITRFLLGEGARLVVVACNSASGTAITHLRATFPIPFVGVEPAVKVAVDSGTMGRIGVLCTPMTARAERYHDLVARVARSREKEVVTVASEVLAGVVERGEHLLPGIAEVVERELQPLLQAQIDAVVLGCTHYAFLAGLVRQLSGLPVLEPSFAVARQVQRLYGLAAPSDEGASVIYTTGDVGRLAAFCREHEGLADLPVRRLELG
ncbi:MAG: glutamate racemase [Deltaproteobacteria bacterium]|nr:glutamate racemase [Deltaproteobacteria bacterium]